ncbi:hypothetical protein M0R45_025896 [Rubus argutus]|uniref:Uncharacterized protein n=1 Tax=Rubus argutus TaxID=59490 RepID=A0AAW1WXQ8_RUBAR
MRPRSRAKHVDGYKPGKSTPAWLEFQAGFESGGSGAAWARDGELEDHGLGLGMNRWGCGVVVGAAWTGHG